MHMCAFGAYQLGKELNLEEKMMFAHDVVAPKLYRYSDAAYYSESEYNADDWKFR